MRGFFHPRKPATSFNLRIRGLEPAALPIPVTAHGPGSAFADPTHAKQRHACATRAMSDFPIHSSRSPEANLVNSSTLFTIIGGMGISTFRAKCGFTPSILGPPNTCDFIVARVGLQNQL